MQTSGGLCWKSRRNGHQSDIVWFHRGQNCNSIQLRIWILDTRYTFLVSTTLIYHSFPHSWEFLLPVSLMDIPRGGPGCSWDVKINGETLQYVYLLGGETDISLEYFRGGYCVSGTDWLCPAVILTTSLRSLLWTALPLISIDYTSKHATQQIGSRKPSVVLNCLLKNGKERFSLAQQILLDCKTRWGDWYLEGVSWCTFSL